MKKLLALLLAAVCVFSLFSCGDDTLKDFKKASSSTEPSVVTLNITVGTAYGDLDASYVTTYKEDGSFTVEYSYEEFAASGEGNADDVTVVKTGTVTCDKNGNLSGGSVDGKVETLSGNKLSFNADKMDAKVSKDGDVLTATVKAKNTKAVFGLEIAGDVTLVVTKSEGKLVSYTMTYTLESGDVVVKCLYQ